jgi:hypothetical protein
MHRDDLAAVTKGADAADAFCDQGCECTGKTCLNGEVIELRGGRFILPP